jgi:hypothetical protein
MHAASLPSLESRRMPRPPAPAPWQNRIVGDATVDPTTLVPNDLNWRVHGERQRAALAGVLADVGWVQRILVNQRTGRIVDGHLRLTLALDRHEATVPVLYVDLSDAEERLILATLDPLAAMAETDRGALTTLLHQVQSNDVAVQAMLSALAQDTGVVPPEFEPVGVEEQGRLDERAKLTCPECGCEFTP